MWAESDGSFPSRAAEHASPTGLENFPKGEEEAFSEWDAKSFVNRGSLPASLAPPAPPPPPPFSLTLEMMAEMMTESEGEGEERGAEKRS